MSSNDSSHKSPRLGDLCKVLMLIWKWSWDPVAECEQTRYWKMGVFLIWCGLCQIWGSKYHLGLKRPRRVSTRFSLFMSLKDIIKHLHHPDTTLSPVCHCDTPNWSDRNTHWSADDLHRITGCRRFKKYKPDFMKTMTTMQQNGAHMSTRARARSEGPIYCKRLPWAK